MLRYILPALALSLMLATAQAASLKEMELTRTLEQVARQSSEGTPRRSTRTFSIRVTPWMATR